jgi:segregation and condensation protein A
VYKIKLEEFEGPLDLLLFFIKRDEVDIYDIPISKITKEFIDYIHLLQQLDLEVAGDFILMASSLMQIKVRMLLPREVNAKGEEIDPRDDLVKALVEYKRYKEMAEELNFFESNQNKLFFRQNYSEDEIESPPEYESLLKNISIYDLIKAFKNALMEKKVEYVHQIKKMNFSIDEQASYIWKKLTEKQEVVFLELVGEMVEKLRIIVTFIAILEMIKVGKIGIKESPNFNDFIIYRIDSGEDIQLDN